MRTLHFGLRVADLERSLSFYEAVGYEVVGSVPETSFGHLTMLKLPDDEFVTLELVFASGSGRPDSGAVLNHFVIMTRSLEATAGELEGKGIEVKGLGERADPADPRTAWITDPDGNPIELVEWPAGHPDGMTAADWTT